LVAVGLDDLRAFLEVAERRSILRAATALGVSRATLTRQLDALEAQAGVVLLTRTARGAQLTEAGQRLLDRGRRLDREYGALLTSVRDAGRVPEGELNLVLQLGLHPGILSMLYHFMQEQWPRVRFAARFHERPWESDLDGAEIVVQLGDHARDDRWVSKVVATIRRRLLASRVYLETHGRPDSVEALRDHSLIVWPAPGEEGDALPLLAGARAVVRPNAVIRDPHVVHILAHNGQGIAFAPDAEVAPLPGYEPLEPVLEDVVGDQVRLVVSTPRQLQDVPRVRAVCDNLDQLFGLVTAASTGRKPAG
jgi:DNA-binding transcriptional LysR family regulator